MEDYKMTLKYQLDSLEGLDEHIAKLYKEEDGKFILDVTGHEKPEDKDKGNMVPKTRLDQEIEKRKEAEKGLQEICDNLVEDIAEDKRSIIPDLSPSKKIVWIREANKQGVFEEKQVNPPVDTKRPGDQKPDNFDNMTPQAIMAKGYKTK
jgi:hypothetical protein